MRINSLKIKIYAAAIAFGVLYVLVVILNLHEPPPASVLHLAPQPSTLRAFTWEQVQWLITTIQFEGLFQVLALFFAMLGSARAVLFSTGEKH